MTDTPLTEAEREIVCRIILAFEPLTSSHQLRLSMENSPQKYANLLAEARRQLWRSGAVVWEAGRAAAAVQNPVANNDPDLYEPAFLDCAQAYEAKIRAHKPPASLPVSPLVEENAKLRSLLKRWCQCPEITEVGGEDLDEETDRVWRLTRAALANHEPREGGE